MPYPSTGLFPSSTLLPGIPGAVLVDPPTILLLDPHARFATFDTHLRSLLTDPHPRTALFDVHERTAQTDPHDRSLGFDPHPRRLELDA